MSEREQFCHKASGATNTQADEARDGGSGIVSRTVWRRRGAPPGEMSLVWACFPEEFAVFDRRTGGTHLLDLFAAELVDRLEQGPAAEYELAALHADLVGCSVSAVPSLESVLAALSRSGLVERIDKR
jgi:PqqD family protein of HPr-rel-A system